MRVERNHAMNEYKIFTHHAFAPKPFCWNGEAPYYIILKGNDFYYYNPCGTIMKAFPANHATYSEATKDGSWVEVTEPEGFQPPTFIK